MSPAVLVQRSASGGAAVDPERVGGRLSLLSGVPASPLSQIGISTLRWTPSDAWGRPGSGRTTLWNGSALEVFTETADVALALATLTTNRIYDVFLWNNAGTRALELSAWAGHGQTMTGATNATPIVITAASHGLANGDEVYVDNVKPDHVTPPVAAPNGTWIVASATTNTFALSGSVGSVTWARGGYFTARAGVNLLTMQNGMRCRLGAPTRRYVGTFRATSATTTEDSFAKRFVWNAYNQVARPFWKTDWAENHAIQNVPQSTWATAYRLWPANATRVEFVQGLPGQPITIHQAWFGFGASISHIAMVIGIDGVPRDDFMRTSEQFTSTNVYIPGTLRAFPYVQNGHHTIDIMESEVLNVAASIGQGVTTGTLWA